jgi:hypothetical protein
MKPTPRSPHEQLRRLLAGKGHEHGEFRWHHVLGLVMQVAAARSAESARLLGEIAEFEGRLVFDGRHGHPHAMPPADLLRIMAVQILAGWDRVRYRRTIRRAARVSQSHAARAIAQRLAG